MTLRYRRDGAGPAARLDLGPARLVGRRDVLVRTEEVGRVEPALDLAEPIPRGSGVGLPHAFLTLAPEEVDVGAAIRAERRGELRRPLVVDRSLVRVLEEARRVDHDPAVAVGVRGRVVGDAGDRSPEHADLRHRHHRRGRRDAVDDRLGRRRQHQDAPDHCAELVQPEAEAGDDAEVAAAAADRPEQVGLRVRIDAEHLAVSGDELGAEQGVDREPVLRERNPTPPPSVIPATPTEGESPKPVARPWAAAWIVYSPAASPAPAQAVRPSASSSIDRSSERSITTPSSTTLSPETLWPPLRTDSSIPVRRAKAIVAATSAGLVTRTIAAGRRSIPP